MPIDDWQFWVVTVLALGGLLLVVRPLLPSKRPPSRCGTCPTASAPGEPAAGRKATLTVEGRRVG